MSSYTKIDGWKSNIRFSSAHIIPEYEKCGRLHGHCYAIHIKIVGEPDKKGIIVDFTQVKKILKEIAEELDHKVLIPEKNILAKIEKHKNFVKIVVLNKEYIFPLEDCVFLPMVSTSAENLAGYILDEVIKKLDLPDQIDSIGIGVDEGFGQGARILKKL